jgi:hypothetical protein
MTRIPCCIPFCNRSVAPDKHPGALEVICAKHWKMAQPMARRIYRRRQARARARPDDQALQNSSWRLWCVIRDRIIRTEAGI